MQVLVSQMLKLFLVVVLTACPLMVSAADLIEGRTDSAEIRQDELLERGMHLLLNAHFDESLAVFNEVIRLSPDDPAGYFYRAGAYWWLMARDPTDRRFDEQLLAHLEEAVEKGEAWRDRYEDARGLLYLGGAFGFRARYRVLRKEWLSAARDAKRGVKHLRRAVELDPELYDAYLGLGMYDYYASVLPGYVKAVQVLLMIPRGNRERGLEELELAREKGRFTRDEAQFFLADIYLDYEKKYTEALQLTLDLRRRYPDNPYFHLLEGVIYVDRLAYFTRAQTVLGDLMTRADRGEYPFSEDVALRSRYYLGKAHLWRREYEEALPWFEELIKRDPTHPSWIVAWSHFRMGQAYDLMDRREDAIAAYKRVLEEPEVGELHEHARDRIEEPFSLRRR